MGMTELLNQYCPDGCEYKPLWKLTSWDKRFKEVDNSKQNKIDKYHYYLAAELDSILSDNGDVKVLTTNKTNLYTTDELAGNNVVNAEIVCIPWGGNPIVQYYNGKFVTGDNRIARVLDANELNTKYLYYTMSNQIKTIASFYRGSGIKHPAMANVLDLEIPVPPLPVQEEIVRILDKFTELEQELEQELELRKKQYEYNRDKMLLNANDIEWIPIGELGDIIRGKRFVHKDDTECGVPAIHYGELYTHYGISAVNTKTHIRADLAPKMRYAHTGDVVIVGAGENKIDIGVGVAWMGNEDIAVHDACFILTNHVQNPKYISYCLRTEDYHRKLYPFVSEGKICSFLKEGLAQVTLPIPKERKVQDEIVELLDKFSTLTSDISEGLPAEIKMRHQQYEYYRDKLLNFKRLEVA